MTVTFEMSFDPRRNLPFRPVAVRSLEGQDPDGSSNYLAMWNRADQLNDRWKNQRDEFLNKLFQVKETLGV
jgi:hypothetical protein